MPRKERPPRELEAALDLFRRWGREGGRTRAKQLTPEERSEIARRAVQARWAKARDSSLTHIVADYIRRYRPSVERSLRRYRRMSLEQAIASVAPARYPGDGRRYPVERRPLNSTTLVYVSETLPRLQAEIRGCRDFGALFNAIKSGIGRIRGVGDQAIYDIALFIAASLGFEPEQVYVTARAKAGAMALGFTASVLDLTELPTPFRRLRPREAEDILSLYRDDLIRIAGGGRPGEPLRKNAPAPRSAFMRAAVQKRWEKAKRSK